MCYVIFQEVLSVILLLIKSDNARNAKFLEYFYILFRVVTITLISIPFLYRSHECHEFTRNNPVDIAVLNTFIILVLLYIKRSEIVPFKLNSVLEALKALQHGALVQAITFTRISVRLEQTVVRSEHIPGFFGCAIQDYYHESTHQECSIDHFVSLVGGAVVEYSIIRIVLVSQQPSELSRVSMHHRKVQRPEIFVEWEVSKIVINIEKECILVILRWFRTRNPIQFIFYDFDGSANYLVPVYLLLYW